MERPIVGISMGDPFGNGPEITVKALNDPEVYKTCRPLVVGDRSCMEYALAVSRKVNGIDLKLNLVESPAQGRYEYGTIDLIDLGIVPKDKIPDTLAEDPPKAFDVDPCALGGEAAFQYVVKVIDLAMKKEIQATVTNALSKEAINMAGHHYSGHTEIYAEYTGTKKYAMMLAHHDFRVVHVSTHVSLREACDRVKKARVLEVIEIADQVCRDMGIEHPKVAVAGLNPTAARTGCSAVRRSKRSNPPSTPPRPRASTPSAPAPRTACSARPLAAGTISWWSCTTIRATFPSRPSALCMTARSSPGRPWKA